jgi:uncharacterized membrane protein
LAGRILALLALAYLGLSHFLGRALQDAAASRVSFHTGVALIAIAVPVDLDLAWVTLSWAALSAVLLVHGVYQQDRAHRIAGLAVLALALSRVLTVDLPLVQGRSESFRVVFNGEFLAGLAVVGILGWLAAAYRRLDLDSGAVERRLSTPLVMAAVSVFWWKGTFEVLAGWGGAGIAETGSRPRAGVPLFWAVYAGAVLGAGLVGRFKPLRTIGLIQLCLAVGKLVLWDTLVRTGPHFRVEPFVGFPFVAGAVLVTVIFGLAWMYRRFLAELGDSERRFATAFLLTGLCVLIWHLSAEILYMFAFREHLGGAAGERRSLLTLSLVWAVYSGAIIGAGFFKRFQPLRLLGIAMLGITVLKVFLVDLTELDSGYRIAAFIGLGILVLLVSLLYQRVRPHDRVQAD